MKKNQKNNNNANKRKKNIQYTENIPILYL